MNRLALELIGGIGLLLAASLWWHSHNKKEQEIGAQQCLAQVQVQAAADKEQGEKAVEDALATEAKNQKARDAERDAKEQSVRERIQKEATVAHAKAADLQRRYETAIATNPTCEQWPQQIVACPLE